MKIFEFFVKRRVIILAVMLVLAAACGFMALGVSINSDLTKYLPDDSPMRHGMEVMEEQFPDAENYSIRVMFKGLAADERESVKSRLSGLEYVDSVGYDPDSSDYNKEGYTLYVLNTEYDYDSDEEKALEEKVASEFSDYDVTVRNDSIKSPDIPLTVYLAAFVIIAVILLISCGSYFEPLLFLINIAIAIILNLGTNIILGEISDITAGVAAILQLALSMDYSIILMNRYRQELQKTDDREKAMSNALHAAFSSITGSAVTTIVGLLVLVFMRFKIGMDIGIVLAKGVAFSMICVFTVLPSLILVSHKVIEKTKKKKAVSKENRALSALGGFEHKARFVIAPLFVLLIIGTAILQTQTTTVYTLRDKDPIADVFPSENTLVMLYENSDETAAEEILRGIEADSEVKSVSAYCTTLGKRYTADEMYDTLKEMLSGDKNAELTPDMLGIIYYDYYEDGKIYPMTLSEFVSVMDMVKSNPAFGSLISAKDAESISSLGQMTDKNLLQAQMPPAALAAALGTSEESITQLFMLRFMENYTPDKTMSLYEYLTFVESLTKNPEYAAMFGEVEIASLMKTKYIADAVISDKTFTPAELAEFLGFADENSLSALYLYVASRTHSDSAWTLSLDELFAHMYELTSDSRFDKLITSDLKKEITDSKSTIDDAIKQLRSEKYSLAVITSAYPDESEKTTAFMTSLNGECDEKLSGDHYLIGNSEMVYELETGFERELLTITLMTAISIFIVVALTFRSFIIPAILVLIVQCGVFVTVSAVGLFGGSIYYLALLIVECILMGATIDYGIVFTSYYREARAEMDVKNALVAAYNGSIHTVLTSGSIMVLVTMVVGPLFGNPPIEQIVKTLSVGALSAIILILFMLPALIAVFDRWVRKKQK